MSPSPLPSSLPSSFLPRFHHHFLGDPASTLIIHRCFSILPKECIESMCSCCVAPCRLILLYYLTTSIPLWHVIHLAYGFILGSASVETDAVTPVLLSTLSLMVRAPPQDQSRYCPPTLVEGKGSKGGVVCPSFHRLSRPSMNMSLLRVDERLGYIVQRDNHLLRGYLTARSSQLLVCVATTRQHVANASTPKALKSPTNMRMFVKGIYTTIGKPVRLHKWYSQCIGMQRY